MSAAAELGLGDGVGGEIAGQMQPHPSGVGELLARSVPGRRRPRRPAGARLASGKRHERACRDPFPVPSGRPRARRRRRRRAPRRARNSDRRARSSAARYTPRRQRRSCLRRHARVPGPRPWLRATRATLSQSERTGRFPQHARNHGTFHPHARRRRGAGRDRDSQPAGTYGTPRRRDQAIAACDANVLQPNDDGIRARFPQGARRLPV